MTGAGLDKEREITDPKRKKGKAMRRNEKSKRNPPSF